MTSLAMVDCMRSSEWGRIFVTEIRCDYEKLNDRLERAPSFCLGLAPSS